MIIIFQAKMPIILQFVAFLSFISLQTKYLSLFLDCWWDKTSNLKISTSAMENYKRSTDKELIVSHFRAAHTQRWPQTHTPKCGKCFLVVLFFSFCECFQNRPANLRCHRIRLRPSTLLHTSILIPLSCQEYTSSLLSTLSSKGGKKNLDIPSAVPVSEEKLSVFQVSGGFP